MDCIIWEMLDPWRRILLASTERRSALLFRAVVAFLELALGLALARARARTALVFRIGTFPSLQGLKWHLGGAWSPGREPGPLGRDAFERQGPVLS